MTKAPLPTASPPIRTYRLGSSALVALGIALVPLLIFLAIKLDESRANRDRRIRSAAGHRTDRSRSLTEAQIAEAQVATEFPDSTEAKAGWIQVVDQETGTLAKRSASVGWIPTRPAVPRVGSTWNSRRRRFTSPAAVSSR